MNGTCIYPTDIIVIKAECDIIKNCYLLVIFSFILIFLSFKYHIPTHTHTKKMRFSLSKSLYRSKYQKMCQVMCSCVCVCVHCPLLVCIVLPHISSVSILAFYQALAPRFCSLYIGLSTNNMKLFQI